MLSWQRFPLHFALERLLLGHQFTQISCNTESLKFYQQRYPVLLTVLTTSRTQ